MSETPCNTGEAGCNYATQAAAQAAKAAVRETFAILGVDIDSPAEVEEFRKSLRFGDTLRKAADKGVLALVVVITGMGAAALWAGVLTKVKGGTP